MTLPAVSITQGSMEPMSLEAGSDARGWLSLPRHLGRWVVSAGAHWTIRLSQHFLSGTKGVQSVEWGTGRANPASCGAPLLAWPPCSHPHFPGVIIKSSPARSWGGKSRELHCGRSFLSPLQLLCGSENFFYAKTKRKKREKKGKKTLSSAKIFTYHI